MFEVLVPELLRAMPLVLTGVVVTIVGSAAYLWRAAYLEGKKRDRLVDALIAEIELGFAEGKEILSNENLEYLKNLIKKQEKPRIVIADGYYIFMSHRSELSLLDRNSLSDVIRYYEMDNIVSAALKSFQDEDFMKLTEPRKERQISAFVEMVEKYREAGEAVLTSLRALRPSRQIDADR